MITRGGRGGVCNLAEYKAFLSFYQAIHTNLRTHVFLKWAGFKINGLQTPFEGFSASQGHVFLWCEPMQWGICSCGGWERDGKPLEFNRIQHGIHKRLV